jgi:5'-nucleotidase
MCVCGSCGRVLPGTDRVTVDLTAGYRVTMNSFLATAKDGFTVFDSSTNQLGGEVDLDALLNNSPVVPGPQNRIRRLNWTLQR